ncbi:uncharacterized protein LOC129892023 [Solanum dulcamara]|uniref:uncharacterized protein LOC129892023 n=1 Tax=Solanum dulcamara TaxID=45834 RepID=UPI00248681D4|nr:uncharacterized protein LOC129892023 [Solanum dulcamara]
MEPDFHFEESLPDKSKSTQYFFQQTHEQKLKDMETHFDFQQIEEENEDDEEEEGEMTSLDEVYSQLRERHVSRSRSDTKLVSSEAPVKLPTKMKKSASMKSPFAHFEEEAIVEA